jgi:hypothetical protein
MISLLKDAAASLGRSIGALKARSSGPGVTIALNDQKVGLGTAKDYLRWAQSMRDINYLGRPERLSDRRPVVFEATRFSYLWTAADAMFSRPGVHSLVGTIHHNKGELGNFKSLFDFAAIPASVVNSKRTTLLDILRTEIATIEPIPGIRRKILPVWQAIYFKYTSTPEKRRGIGKYIGLCLTSGQQFAPDLPTLVYGSRNWHFHGVLLSTSFRGPAARQLLYYRTLNETMAEFFASFATNLLARL